MVQEWGREIIEQEFFVLDSERIWSSSDLRSTVGSEQAIKLIQLVFTERIHKIKTSADWCDTTTSNFESKQWPGSESFKGTIKSSGEDYKVIRSRP